MHRPLRTDPTRTDSTEGFRYPARVYETARSPLRQVICGVHGDSYLAAISGAVAASRCPARDQVLLTAATQERIPAGSMLTSIAIGSTESTRHPSASTPRSSPGQFAHPYPLTPAASCWTRRSSQRRRGAEQPVVDSVCDLQRHVLVDPDVRPIRGKAMSGNDGVTVVRAPFAKPQAETPGPSPYAGPIC